MQFNALWMMKNHRALVLVFIAFIAAGAVLLDNADNQKEDEAEDKDGNEKKVMVALQHAEKEMQFFAVGGSGLKNPFKAGERPVQASEKNNAAGMHHVESKKIEKIDFVLTGIVEHEAERIAIIESRGKSGLYRENEKIGAYKVARIMPGRVLLMKGNGQIELKVTRW